MHLLRVTLAAIVAVIALNAAQVAVPAAGIHVLSAEAAGFRPMPDEDPPTGG